MGREFKHNGIPKLFRVIARSVRDRYNLLTKRMQAKLKVEEKSIFRRTVWFPECPKLLPARECPFS